MSIEKIPYEGLRTLIKRNPDFNWPQRTETNRLEPICQPSHTASFEIKQNDKVITVPEKWSGLVSQEFIDIIPPSWIKIKF